MLKDLGQVEEAVAHYETARQLAPDNAVIHGNLGNLRRDQQRLDDAIASYRRALALKPDYAAASYNLGRVLAGRGELGEAVSVLGRAARQLEDASIEWAYVRR